MNGRCEPKFPDAAATMNVRLRYQIASFSKEYVVTIN